MAQQCEVTVCTHDVVHSRFGGVGFQVSHHLQSTGKAHFEQVLAKRWREMNPSFARLGHMVDGDSAMLDQMADHLSRLKGTGTEVYLTTWNPEDTREGAGRVAYAKGIVDDLEYLVRERGATNIKYYCMTNELSLNGWGELINDLPKFKDYHQKIFDELKARGLDVQLLATDASPMDRWHSIEWATANMDDITGVYGGHHYVNDYDLGNVEFYPWFLSKMKWGSGIAARMKKHFILGEFGCRQDFSTRDSVRMDVCIHFGTAQEPMVGIQLSEAVIAALNGGIHALANWTFSDYPDSYRENYANKWGTFKWSGSDYSTRAHYYAYGLMTTFFRGPSTVFAVRCSDRLLRAAAVQHGRKQTYSIAVVNRRKDDVPVTITVDGERLTADFQKYVYDPENVPMHPFGDLQDPLGKVAMQEGRLVDTVGSGTLTVYTTAYDEQPPAPVKGLAVEETRDGKRRLKWEPNPEPDLCYYRIYRSPRPDFAPGTPNQMGSTIATEFLDQCPLGGAECHYKVAPVDQSGNAGKPARLTASKP